MNAHRIALAGIVAGVALAATTIAGCSKKTTDRLVPNLPPTVRLTAAPFDTSRASSYFYAYRIDWIGNDPDGRIDYFLYAIDPPAGLGATVSWTRTTNNEQIVFFTADSSNADNNIATRPHVFSLCAVDNRGDTSDVVSRGFYSYTQCPTVTIISPRPNRFSPIFCTPSVRVTWNGTDPDGQLTSKPVKYKYLLLGPGGGFPIDRAVTDPPSLRNYYAYDWASHSLPGPWAGWDSTSADTTFHQFTGLTPNQDFLFVVVAFDEAGAFSPVFDLSQNMLRLRPGFASTNGPKITMYNEFFVVSLKGGWVNDPAAYTNLEVPAQQPITFNWSAEPPTGAIIESYRWMLDGDPANDATRTDVNDFKHWSDAGVGVLSATVGPFGPGEHLFYVESRDNNGLASLGIVHMTVIQATFEKPLLIVFDVRLQPEAPVPGGGGCLRPPTGNWPNEAECDSFLFARGGVTWQCVTPAGNSDPGIFAGYDFNVYRTTSTVGLDKTVRLAILGQYRNVVWIIDANSTLVSPLGGAYGLVYMSSPGKINTLGAYVRQGGKVWLAGGGAATALCKNLFNSANNDIATFTYSNRQPTELQPGRMMYDIVHWRSELQNYVVADPQMKKSVRAIGGWTMPTWAGGRSAPDYNGLPTVLQNTKVQGPLPDGDPLPATRALTPSSFYRTQYRVALEYLSQPNSILEDIDPAPDNVVEQATLDTLMKSEAVLAFGRAWEIGGLDPLTGLPKPGSVVGTPLMTYYHGLEFPEFVFSGFDLWNYRRPQLVQMVEFVLGQVMNLNKTAPRTSALRAAPGAPRVWSPATGAARAVPTGRSGTAVPAAATAAHSGSDE